MVSIYGYVRYKESKYIEVAMDYKETIYKATEISYMMVYNIKRINDNSILLINDNQHKGENEKCVALDQVMKNRMHVDNIIRKGGDVIDNLLKLSYVDMDKMRELQKGHNDEQKVFEKIHTIAKKMINHCKRGKYPANEQNPYEKERNDILDLLEETDHSIGSISDKNKEDCHNQLLLILND